MAENERPNISKLKKFQKILMCDGNWKVKIFYKIFIEEAMGIFLFINNIKGL